MKIDNLRYVSNSIGVAATATMIIPTLSKLVPLLQVCAMTADSPQAGVGHIYACLAIGSVLITGCISAEIALGYSMKKITEVVLKRFFLDKELQQPKQNSIKI